MDNIADTELTVEDVAEIKKQIAEYTEIMKVLVEEIRRDRAEIDRLKAETRAMLDQLKITSPTDYGLLDASSVSLADG